MRREYTVVVERGESGVFVGWVPGLHGAHSQGTTLDELLANMREVIQLCLEEAGAPSDEDLEFVGVHRVAV
ncbi:MAG TPA: type II toxin-antitoxin system HicB family antitoxin [Tepidiformaceae bacterium]|nr:type II toxin-antitoxin system HicB family antitoxin [Tepidiformaceae bacterium]